MARIGRVARVQAIKTATTCTFDERLRRLAVLEQILLHVLVDVLQVGRRKKRVALIKDMLGQLLNADAALTHPEKYLQYLLVVCHIWCIEKRVGKLHYQPFIIDLSAIKPA